MTNDYVLAGHNIGYSINNTKLFKNINFEAKKGESIHIKGSNGSGKTTLLRIIAGICSSSNGEVIIGEEISKVMVGHSNALKDYLTLKENILMDGSFDIKDTNIFLESLNLKNKLELKIGSLSFGQRKKASLLKVFNNNSDLIILDEPCVGLDAKTQTYLIEFLKKELAKGKTIVYSSHIDMNLDSIEVYL